jgi:transposase-like protein
MPNFPKCKSNDVIKNGFIHNENQNHKCKACGRQFVETPWQKNNL